jgi:hypothetical protein
MLERRQEQITRMKLSQAHRAIVTGGEQAFAVRTEPSAVDRPVMKPKMNQRWRLAQRGGDAAPVRFNGRIQPQRFSEPEERRKSATVIESTNTGGDIQAHQLPTAFFGLAVDLFPRRR